MKTNNYLRLARQFTTAILLLVTSLLSARADTYIANFHRKGTLSLDNNGVGGRPIFASTTQTQWLIEPIGTSVRIKSVTTGNYLNNETGQLQCTTIQPEWLSARWTLKPVQDKAGFFLIINDKTKEYLHVERGPLELTPIASESLTSAFWLFAPTFSMIIASDTQFPWNATHDAREQTDSEKYNREFVKTMNELTNQLGNVKGVTINGDLTNFGHGWQLNKFKEIYSALKVPMHVSLGNHDYSNNVDDSFENSAPNTMVEYMVEQLKAKKYPNTDYKVENGYNGVVYTTITGSLAYSWDEGNVHFVQLQYYPLYEREWSNYDTGAAKRKTVKITNSFNWLNADLNQARNAGKAIIVFLHDPYDHWNDKYVPGVRTEGNTMGKRPDADAKSAEFANMLRKYQVSAVFGGHIHENHGLSDRNYRGSGVPMFYSGSADFNHYLLAKFDDNKMTVEKITSTNGVLKREDGGEYPLFAPKPASACGCAAKTFRSDSDHSWVEFRLPKETAGKSISIPGGAYNKYVFPKCNRVWWEDLTFKCNATTCQWEKVSGNFSADGLCHGSKGNSSYVFVGDK